jgi:hypothetical protein
LLRWLSKEEISLLPTLSETVLIAYPTTHAQVRVSLLDKVKFALVYVAAKIECFSNLKVSAQEFRASVVLINNAVSKQAPNTIRGLFQIYVITVKAYNDFQKEIDAFSRYNTDVLNSDAYKSSVFRVLNTVNANRCHVANNNGQAHFPGLVAQDLFLLAHDLPLSQVDVGLNNNSQKYEKIERAIRKELDALFHVRKKNANENQKYQGDQGASSNTSQTYWQELKTRVGGMKGITIGFFGFVGILLCVVYFWHSLDLYWGENIKRKE